MKKILLFSLIALSISGCNTQNSLQETVEKTISSETKTEIVASFYPLAFMAEEIGGDTVNVINLSGSVSPHKYELTPHDLVKLNNADLVIYQGIGLETWNDEVINSEKVAILEISRDLPLEKRTEHKEHDEHEEDSHNEHEEEDEHNHGEFDPHTWLSPILAQKMVDDITKSLSAVNPAKKEFFEKNADKLKEKFKDMDSQYREALKNCEQDEVIVSHNAFGYIASEYGFETHSIAGLSPNDEPSAKILAELKEEAAEGISHILVEKNSVQRFADTLSRETGLETLSINPLGRGTLDPEKDFFNITSENLESFKTALKCQ